MKKDTVHPSLKKLIDQGVTDFTKRQEKELERLEEIIRLIRKAERRIHIKEGDGRDADITRRALTRLRRHYNRQLDKLARK